MLLYTLGSREGSNLNIHTGVGRRMSVMSIYTLGRRVSALFLYTPGMKREK